MASAIASRRMKGEKNSIVLEKSNLYFWATNSGRLKNSFNDKENVMIWKGSRGENMEKT